MLLKFKIECQPVYLELAEIWRNLVPVVLLFMGAVSHKALNLKQRWNFHTTKILLYFTAYLLLTRLIEIFAGKITLATSSWWWNLITSFYPQSVKSAIAEEILFRGILQTWLSARLSTVRRGEFFAILLTALFFGLYHYPFLYITLYKATFVGFLFGWSYSSTKNLWVPIIFHSLINTTSYSIFVFT